MQFTSIGSLSGVDAAAWDGLVAHSGGGVFLSHAWLAALETTGAVGARTGWQPMHLLALDAGRLVGALPLYLKQHSYGEFVFDWAWADAYRRHGLAYYPKLVAAIPFTPCPGPRLLALREDVAEALIDAALGLARTLGVSSLHVLLPNRDEASRWAAHGLLQRQGVQFHWQNRAPSPYQDFDDMLSAMSHDKRKKIRQDRRYVAEAGVRFRVLRGAAITAADWAFFFRCYENT
ncbi:MAG: peptidogalycan biosysnthesis protein, partial [Casimicrobiaceae bacterium]